MNNLMETEKTKESIWVRIYWSQKIDENVSSPHPNPSNDSNLWSLLVPTPASSQVLPSGKYFLPAVDSPPARKRANMTTIFPHGAAHEFQDCWCSWRVLVFLTYPTFSSVAHLCNYPSNPLQIHLTSLELWNQYTHLGLISNEHNSRITLLFLKIAGKISKQTGTTLPHIISDAISYSRRVCLSKLQLTTSLQLFLTYKSSWTRV